MIRTVIRISALRLWHNRPELVLTFVVPILFFSIFAWIFGSRSDSGSTPKLKIAVCDELGTEVTQETIRQLISTNSLTLHSVDNQSLSQEGYSNFKRTSLESLVKRGVINAGLVFTKSDDASQPEKIEILTDSFDQVAGQVVVALVQKSAMAARLGRPSSMIHPGNATEWSSGSSVVSADGSGFTATYPQPANAVAYGTLIPPTIALVDTIGAKKSNPMIAMYAAGIAVMFVLFSAATAGGTLLEERENSVLERLFCTGMTVDHLLLGKWIYLTCIGIAQIGLMFGFGALVFNLDLKSHLDGFVALTIVTSGAASAFALMLATLCKTRTQLGWLSTIVNLSMSALGGSMVPRYLMSENIQRVGQFTFNAWALDGYNKIFWRDLPLFEIRRELAVLMISGLAFIIIARLALSRWERN
jgi:ABC-2 type transport system permease protein